MIWVPFLHWYQPANIDGQFIHEAVAKSYRYILDKVEASSDNLRMTWNVSACLLHRLEELGYDDIIRRIGALVATGRIELVGSAAYHPIVPLISESEARRQILEQEAALLKYFGVKPKGFFLPEMAYSPKTGKIIKSLGYQYIILDEISVVEKENKNSHIYRDRSTGMLAVTRSRRLSNRYTPSYIAAKLRNDSGYGALVVTASDAELYGLRHVDRQDNFGKISAMPGFSSMTISEFIESRSEIGAARFRASSWESSEQEISRNEPFAIWDQKGNNLHKKLWRLASLAQAASVKFADDNNISFVLWHLSRGLASCMFWWASGHDFSRHFGPVAWSPDEVERGLNDLIRSIRAISDKKSLRLKKRAEKLNVLIIKELWLAHWRRQ